MGTRDAQDRILLTVDDAAKFLNQSRATVYRLIKKGLLEKVKLEGKRSWLIPMDSLETMQTANTFTLPELAARLLRVEKKLDFLLTQGNSVQPAQANAVQTTVTDYAELQRQMKKRFPGLVGRN